MCDSTGSYVLACSWSGQGDTESGCGLGSSGQGSQGGGDAVEHQRGMCNRCREEDMLSKEEERIVAVHRKRDWMWVEGAQEGAGDSGSRKGAVGASGWWKKLKPFERNPFKRPVRSEDEVGLSRHGEESDEQALAKGVALQGALQGEHAEAGGLAGLACPAAAEGEDGEGVGEPELVAGGRADLTWLRKHVFDDQGEQVCTHRCAMSLCLCCERSGLGLGVMRQGRGS
jgi:hypothetical protein